MSPRWGRVLALGLVAGAIALIIATVPLGVAATRMEPGTIVVLGDASTPSMQQAVAELRDRVADGDGLVPSFGWPDMVLRIVFLGWVATGALIVSRRASNLAGWAFVGIGLALILTQVGTAVAVYGAKANPGSVPGLGFWAAVGEYSFIAIAFVPLLFLLYPDGRPPSPRWRWAGRALLAGIALGLVGFLLEPGPLNNFVDLGIVYQSPTGIEGAGFLGVVVAVGVMMALAASLACVVALVLRFRRSTGEERQKLRWLAFVAGVAGGFVALTLLMGLTGEILGIDDEGTAWIFDIPGTLAAVTLFVGVPAAYLIAIFRHGLWQLDVVVKKTVLYATLVVSFLAVGGVLVFGAARVVVGSPSDIEWVLVVAGLVMGLLFMPLRRLATRMAEKVVYGKRVTPYQALADFSGRLGGTYGTEDVLPRMAALLATAVGAETARVWLRISGRLVPEASWPDGPPLPAIAMPGDELPSIPGEQAFTVGHHGEVLGALSVRMPPSDPMNGSKERLVRDLASQAGLVLRNVRLIEDLRASRKRLVSAQDEERRRLERNLHDGAQQQLVALSVKVGLAEKLAERDPTGARGLLAQARDDASDALENLRDLARGIYPPLLADQGLAAALTGQGRKSSVPVEVRAENIGRHPQDVEAAVYFSALEALQNVAKYANASRAVVNLWQADGTLGFSVQDDGQGFDPSATSYGTGLQGIADRLDAIGGKLDVRSVPGEGTTVTGTVPVSGSSGR